MRGAERVRALRRLHGAREALLLAGVLVAAPLVPALMRLPLPKVDRILKRVRGARAPEQLSDERVAAVVDAAQQFAHPVVRRGCLTRGVSLFVLLRERAGHEDLRLCFGIGGPADDFYGHCWLEHHGEPHLEKEDPRERFPAQFALPLPG
jgi:hypothetical protein